MPRLPRPLRWLLLGAVTLVLLGAAVTGIVLYSVSSRLPDVQSLRNIELQEPMYVYARDGRLMGLFGEMRRYPVDIKDVPLQVKQAFLAAEDARFYEHHGVDFKGVARAIWLLATTDDKRVPGGSTITQQVARQFFLSSEYSYTRKLAEMLLAMKMERELSKDEILGLYLNKSFFGNRAYGVAAAAEFYYGKKLGELTLDEAATLAGTPSSRPAAIRWTTRNATANVATTTSCRAWPSSAMSAPPRPKPPSPCRCTPPRTSARSRSTRPTSRKWSART